MLQGLVQFFQRRFDSRVFLFVDGIDFRVVGNRLQGDVRHCLVDEAAFQAFLRVFEVVVIVAGRHQPLFGQRYRYPRGIAGDPAAAPFFGDKGCRARAAGGVQH